jgi:hypothetical protein
MRAQLRTRISTSFALFLGEETPTDADHDGSWYCFERVGGKIGSMYVVPLSSKGFAVLIRTMKKLDLKCRHPRSHCTDW